MGIVAVEHETPGAVLVAGALSAILQDREGDYKIVVLRPSELTPSNSQAITYTVSVQAQGCMVYARLNGDSLLQNLS
jgi:predicted NUDIX family phosphoesterase